MKARREEGWRLGKTAAAAAPVRSGGWPESGISYCEKADFDWRETFWRNLMISINGLSKLTAARRKRAKNDSLEEMKEMAKAEAHAIKYIENVEIPRPSIILNKVTEEENHSSEKACWLFTDD